VGSGDPHCEISGVRNPPGFAYDANLNRRGTPLLLGGGPVTFASLILM
jgi:hypothetical protein